MKTALFFALLIVLSLSTLTLRSYAQPKNYRFEHLSVQDGLSQNSVWSIHQDREGFMWFGTQDGLNKYDGYSFTIFKPDPDDSENTLNHNIITDIHEDRKGQLWVTTLGGGLHQVDKLTGRVTRYGINSAHAQFWNVLTTIYEDQKGIFWIGALGGIARFDPVTQQFTLFSSPENAPWIPAVTQDASGQYWAGGNGGVYQLDTSTAQFIPILLDSSLARQPLCSSLYVDRDGILWAATIQEGLFRKDSHPDSTHFTRYDPEGVISKIIPFNGIYEDQPGHLWLSGFGGLQRVDKQTNTVLSFPSDPSQPGKLSHHKVAAVYQDRNGSLWVGTDNGINKVTAHPKQFHSYQLVPSLPSVIRHQNNYNTLLEDHTGMIWLGSAAVELLGNFENGLFQFNPVTQQFKHFPAASSNPDSLGSNHISSVYEDQQKRLWVGTREALHLFDRSTGKFKRHPSEISVENLTGDPSGKLWFGEWLNGWGLGCFDPRNQEFTYYHPHDTTGLKNGKVWDIIVSRTGDLWVALAGGGVARLNQKTSTFTSYLPGSNPGDLNDKDVRSLYEDASGIIWVGTNQGGLHRFDSLTSAFTYYTTRDGLPSNHIASIIGDKRGNLWLGTNQGISRFDPRTETFRNFDTGDGLPANEFQNGSVYGRNGKLMFGSVNGLVIFDPDSIQGNTLVPPVYITGFQVMEEERIVPTSGIELPYDQNFLSFDFVALNYDVPEKNQYAYRLEGVDRNWVYSDNRRFASYTDLDPGEYTFRVKASNNDGVWNEEGASLFLTILPPWWRTGWAYTLYGLLALGAILSLRHYEMKRFRLQQRAEYLVELDSLKTQFFANISHEFRTPLTLILGPVKNLLSKHRGQEDQIYLTSIQRNAQRLLHLVNQLLELSKLEAGKLELEAVKSDLVSFIKVRAYAFSSLADHQDIHFSVDLPKKEVVAYFDPDKLEKIINNLLSNAFKFTTEGGIVNLKGQIVTRHHKDWIQIRVSDSGTGIPFEEQSKVFERFYQANTSPASELEGSGIGLALTKELVELHHGTIEVDSALGKGTVFTILLPLGKEHLKDTEIVSPPPGSEEKKVRHGINKNTFPAFYQNPGNGNPEELENEPEAEKPLVLIVEDHPEVRQFIRDSISHTYQVKEAEYGAVGLAIARKFLPDLIISDVMMPRLDRSDMDGYQLCEKIKTDELTSHIPVILLTARADRESRLSGLEIGADDYLAKPFDTEELLLIVKNRIEERRTMQKKFGQDITLEPQQIPLTSLDQQFLDKVMSSIEAYLEDEDFSIEMLSSEVGYSHVHFYRKLKALTGQTPSQFLRTIRLKRAAAMLQEKSDNVTQIAYSVGFSNLSYFTKCFKNQYGMTPSQYSTAHSE